MSGCHDKAKECSTFNLMLEQTASNPAHPLPHRHWHEKILTILSCLYINKILRENHMIEWCVRPDLTCWDPNHITPDPTGLV